MEPDGTTVTSGPFVTGYGRVMAGMPEDGEERFVPWAMKKVTYADGPGSPVVGARTAAVPDR